SSELRQKPPNGGNRRLIGNEARGEDQPGLLAVQLGKFLLQLDQRMVVSGDVTRAAGTSAHAACRLLHRGNDCGMLAHAQIVVRAPYGDLFGPPVSAPDCAGKAAYDALDIGEDAVSSLCVKLIDRILEEALIVHFVFLILAPD